MEWDADRGKENLKCTPNQSLRWIKKNVFHVVFALRTAQKKRSRITKKDKRRLIMKNVLDADNVLPAATMVPRGLFMTRRLIF